LNTFIFRKLYYYVFYVIPGWRTLVLSWRSLTEQEFNEYSQLINDANNDILNRETKLAKAYDQIESNLTLIGVIKILLYEVS
jgi:hypothetical protein